FPGTTTGIHRAAHRPGLGGHGEPHAGRQGFADRRPTAAADACRTRNRWLLRGRPRAHRRVSRGRGGMSSTCRIRRAIPGDARGIARVHVETWRSAYAGILPDQVIVQMSVDDKAAAWRRLIQRQDAVEAVVVAEIDDGTIIGFASCGPAGP